MPSLSMPLFVNPDDAILRMQLDGSLEGTSDVVSSGIIGAQLHVQRILDGKLSRKSWECIYHLDGESFSGLPVEQGHFRLEIPSPFIREDADVVITATSPQVQGSGVSLFSEYEAVDMTLVKIDYNRGYILMDATTYGKCFVKVVCDTGLRTAPTHFRLRDFPPTAEARRTR